jgi:uncharacterized phage-like protein YoqJ
MWNTIVNICTDEEQNFDEDIHIVTGGALGIDQDAARIAHKHKKPFVVAIPCLNQEKMWPATAQQQYQKMLTFASKVHYVSDKEYTANCMQKRNEWMVDNCDVLVAVWDGSKGGTENCIRYAELVGRTIHYIKLEKGIVQ